MLGRYLLPPPQHPLKRTKKKRTESAKQRKLGSVSTVRVKILFWSRVAGLNEPEHFVKLIIHSSPVSYAGLVSFTPTPNHSTREREREREILLVCALSPVNYRGLRQGWRERERTETANKACVSVSCAREDCLFVLLCICWTE